MIKRLKRDHEVVKEKRLECLGGLIKPVCRVID